MDSQTKWVLFELMNREAGKSKESRKQIYKVLSFLEVG